MRLHSFSRTSTLSVSCEDVFQWHGRAGAFERMQPPWMPPQIVSKEGSIFNGDTLTIKTNLGPIPFLFKAQHQNYIENKQFEDIQLKGPFAFFKHKHKFERVDEKKSKIIDEIEYSLPVNMFSRFLGNSFGRWIVIFRFDLLKFLII